MGDNTQPIDYDIFKKGSPKQSGYFLQITDMHIDDDYLEGTSIKSACHRYEDNDETRAGRWGAVGELCDSPVILAEATIQWISKEWRNKLDFVVWTGDNANHNRDKKKKYKRRHVYDLNQRVTDMMMEAFWPHSHNDNKLKMIPVVPNFGNNDVYPHNLMDGSNTDTELLSFYEQMWKPWIPVNQRPTFRTGGYYSVEVVPRIHVITLNTLYFFGRNRIINNCHHRRSPAYIQMMWFDSQLRNARKDNHKVYVIGHVPPSPRDYKATCLTEYMRIASTYSDVIMGHFFAHLNMDHFLLYDSNDLPTLQSYYSNQTQQQVFSISEQEVHTTRNVDQYMSWLRHMYKNIDALDDKHTPAVESPLVVIQVSPSVLPVYFPTFRIYEYDTKNSSYGTLLGYQQYYANITKWNDSDHLEYELEYSTKEEYGMKDLSVESYMSFAKSMIKNSRKGHRLWALYQNHMVVNTQNYTATS